MVSMLDALVSSESPSDDSALVAATVDLVADLGERLLGLEAKRVVTGGSSALRGTCPLSGAMPVRWSSWHTWTQSGRPAPWTGGPSQSRATTRLGRAPST